MKNDNVDRKSTSYLALCISLGVVFGIVFDKLALCLSLGVALGGLLERIQDKKYEE